MKKLFLFFLCYSVFASEKVKPTLPALKTAADNSAPEWPAIQDNKEKIEISLHQNETWIKFFLADKMRSFVQNHDKATVEEEILLPVQNDCSRRTFEMLEDFDVLGRFFDLKAQAEKFAAKNPILKKKSWCCCLKPIAQSEWRTFLIENRTIKEKIT